MIDSGFWIDASGAGRKAHQFRVQDARSLSLNPKSKAQNLNIPLVIQKIY